MEPSFWDAGKTPSLIDELNTSKMNFFPGLGVPAAYIWISPGGDWVELTRLPHAA